MEIISYFLEIDEKKRIDLRQLENIYMEENPLF